MGRDGEIWDAVLRQAFGQYEKCGDSGFDCYSAQTLAKEVYLDSDTDAAVTALDAAVAANDIVFVKGSLGSDAWRVAAVLLQRLDAEHPTNRKGDSYAA